jgi:peptidoglycan/xylan/chitin deacetylase (PgdA/CDA1 family)
MLKVEREMNIKATYHVVGLYIDKFKEIIEKDRHCLSFHSYDHIIEKHWLYSHRKLYTTIKALLGILIDNAYKRYDGQLEKCRKLDSKIEGYRPPQSIITLELTDENPNFHNFQWVASSAQSLGLKNPKLESGIVKIPISFDDFDLYDKNRNYEKWEKRQ